MGLRMTQKPDVSVVIPSFNSANTIIRCLDSIFGQETDLVYEVIVVDSSNDNTPDLVRNKFPSINLIHLDQQTMPGGARNIGAKKAKADIVSFIDSDCIAHPDWLNTAVDSIHLGHTIIGGAVANATPKSLIGTADYFITFSGWLPGTVVREVPLLPSCNLICQRQAFEILDGFPPELLAGEDMLFSLKAAKKYKLIFDPRITVYHINRKHMKDLVRHQVNFGRHSALLRKEGKLKGSTFAKIPFLPFFAPFVRFFRITQRIVRWNKKMILQFCLASPIVLFGIFAWSCAFIKWSHKPHKRQ
jgi:glycosyltransferase involved in cell wall biosynthesis